jgi:hypothetical protein
MKIGTKLQIAVAGAIVEVAAAIAIVQRAIIRDESITLTQQAMRDAVIQGESVRQKLAKLNSDQAFDMDRLLAEVKTGKKLQVLENEFGQQYYVDESGHPQLINQP